MNEVVEIKVLKDYRVWLRFKDDEVKIVNLRPFLGKGFTAELLDPSKFEKVFIEPGGGIAWENGYDFCPNFLKELEGEKVELA
ncbi:MAG: DUF2442 domain-containing protein [Bacteroidota bacterium]|uniref:DUF2442 domain-containing protein n=1 Tax=Algoriphagus faecimaris TaxID=686796 RepID=A0A1G6NEF4_9BACT|nr:DUF2442 domain-containing protein [Algoriphagus faecimaris]SDC66239.1 Protein of unknown function [Algoriphagus faecimaris]